MLERVLLETRRWVLVKRAAREGLMARLLVERSAMNHAKVNGLKGEAADRALVVAELEAALELTETSINRFAQAMNNG